MGIGKARVGTGARRLAPPELGEDSKARRHTSDPAA